MKYFITPLVLFFTICVSAQHVVSTNPSPSSLGGFDINQSLVDHSTGAFNYSVAITSIRDGNLTFPVNLFYHGSGFRVEQISSWVGMGWNLDAGATITRSVVGFPDDINDEDEGIGILHTNALSEIENISFNDSETTISQSIYPLYTDKKDTQPDIFNLNFFGRNISFLFDKNKDIVFIENQTLKVDYNQDQDGKIISFNIIDENGVSYIFDQIETTTETSTYRTFNVNGNYVENAEEEKTLTFNSAWHLSSISNYANSITLNYYTENIEYNRKKLEVGLICKSQDCNTYPTALGNTNPIKNSKIEISSKKIRSIISSNEKIDFLKTWGTRADLKGGLRLYMIRKTSLIDGSKVDFRLNQQYMISSNIDNNNRHPYYRLQLKSILKNNKKYFDFYYNSTKLPHRESAEQDFWGYYNGNGANSLIPKIYVYPESVANKTSFYQLQGQGQEYVVNGEGRSSNLNFTKAGVLERINDQLGNNIYIDYELNTFKYNNYTFVGNGLRVSKITINEPSNYNYEKTYSYNTPANSTSGVVEMLPSFSYYHTDRSIRYIYNSKIYQETSLKKYWIYIGGSQGFPIIIFDDQGASNWSSFDEHFYSTLRFSLPMNTTISSNYMVYYLNTTESFLDKKITYNFQLNDLQIDFASDLDLIDNSIKRVRVPSDIAQGYGIDPELREQNEPTYFDKQYPFIPELARNWNITTLNEIHYKKGNTLERKETINHSIVKANANHSSVSALKMNFLERPSISISGLSLLFSPYTKNIICSAKYKYLLNANKQVSSQSTVSYEGSNSMGNTASLFQYNSLGLATEKKELIGDKEYKTIYKYPSDLVSQPYMNQLISQNRLTDVIEQEQYLDDQFLGRTTTEYASFTADNLILPYKTRAFNKDNQLVRTSVVSKYNSRGTPLEEYDEESTMHSSSIVAFNDQLVIAHATNAKHNEIYHTSFEEDGETSHPSGENSYTGDKFGRESFTVPFIKPNSKQYVISYWIMDQNNEWSFSGFIPYSNNMIINETVFDEVRVHPIDAKMTTTTYDKLYNLPITKTDEQGTTVRYEYDGLGNLVTILDKHRKVVKKYKYNYKN